MAPRRQHRQQPVHGVTVGIMILDTGFQRLPGDIGYAPTFDFPVQYKVVKGTTSGRVTRPNAMPRRNAIGTSIRQGLLRMGVKPEAIPSNADL